MRERVPSQRLLPRRMPNVNMDDRSPARRYTVQFRLEPTGSRVEYGAVTPMGELMAVSLATARLLMKNPDARISAVAVTNVETDFTVDPAGDALDYWNLN